MAGIDRRRVCTNLANRSGNREMVGFNSPAAFGEAFVKQFKITPAEYQKRCATLSTYGVPDVIE